MSHKCAPPFTEAELEIRYGTGIDERGDALRAWAAARGLSVVGEPEVNRYDPPFKPAFLRRNEVWLEVAAPVRS